MTKHNDYFVGIVLICPTTRKQMAVHKTLCKLSYWDGGGVGIDEVDVAIAECPLCKTKHTITVPL